MPEILHISSPEVRAETPSTSSPNELISSFRSNPVYSEAFNGFFIGKSLVSDVTQDEKIAAFEGSQGAKAALVAFSRDSMRFQYDPQKYSVDSRGSLEEYISIVKKMRYSASAHEIQRLDYSRTMLHNATAKKLTEDGLVPNVNFGRVIARLALVSLDLDTYESAAAPNKPRTL